MHPCTLTQISLCSLHFNLGQSTPNIFSQIHLGIEGKLCDYGKPNPWRFHGQVPTYEGYFMTRCYVLKEKELYYVLYELR